MKHILVTGGLGYIGSHTTLALLEAGFSVLVLDNLDNSFLECLARLQRLAGDKAANLDFIKADIRDESQLRAAFAIKPVDAVIHFAAKKAVGESVANPLKYYTHNVSGTVLLLQAMEEHGCRNLVFSSSACVYGTPPYVPIDEAAPLAPLNPYGRTKVIMEQIAGDLAASDARWRVLLLRYFNPVAAHPSGDIGEHAVVASNLMPAITEAVTGKRSKLEVFGTDWSTKDGSAVRDYIHVQDLADGHVAALRALFSDRALRCAAYNLGTGTGITVLEMIKAFEEASGRKVPWQAAERRPGDAEAVWASPELAEKELGWKAKLGLERMCQDQWRWVEKNPDGYLTQQKQG